ncbi:transmembrane anchor protein [Croceicoccus gelatinilyticus]|uniref:transmembrane anchor protein n=1 Tax=Croceicoccus gelatinilyticus TaxID=2835536 RepID=UPI001BCBF087|nr:transmembrane anchor protein [Croceicoccus gelatinilyticus]MBS7670961.1 transmembrane anchor protein [Croceicoccus gelatinilyticus]
MFNSQRPSVDDLPTSGQLLQASAFALVAAGAVLVAVVLPAEYAIDPTGAGRVLGMTEMGEVKAQLAEEAAADAMLAETQAESVPAVATAAQEAADTPAEAANVRSDVTEITLEPGQAAEIKASMMKNASLEYDWSVAGGAVNFDTHADAPGIDYHGYGKGRNSVGEKGTLTAAFDGSHGWFWRNRSASTVTVTLRTDGAYNDIKKVL